MDGWVGVKVIFRIQKLRENVKMQDQKSSGWVGGWVGGWRLKPF